MISEIRCEEYVSHRTYPLRVATFNDMHVCSKFGLFPEGTTRQSDLNLGQIKLQEYFNHFTEACKEVKPNMAWIPGDVITGVNYIEGGKYVMNIELQDQIDYAAELISQLCEKVPTIQEVWIWGGTPYHGTRTSSVEKDTATMLRADYGIKAIYRNEYSYIDIKYKGLEKHLWITHVAPDGSMYPEMAMGRDMMTWQEAVGKGKLRPIDMIIRAHKHEFVEVHKASIRALQLPCWQFFSPYDGALKNFAKFQPDIGSVVLLFDDKLRLSTWHLLYPNVEDAENMIEVDLDKGVGRKRLSKK